MGRERQETKRNIKKHSNFLNKMASNANLMAHLVLFLGDSLEVFFSNLLVYYTRLPSVLPRVLL